MAAEPTDSPAFKDFIHASDIWSKWDAARRLMADKQMQSVSANAEFLNSFHSLGNMAVAGSGLDQLLAVALIIRISELVKGTVKRDGSAILERALRARPDGFWTISETKKLPLESKPSEIRENIALSLSHANGAWVVPYIIEALAREEKSPRCRSELIRQLAKREQKLSQWLEMLNNLPWLAIFESGTADRIGRLRELALALLEGLREHRGVVVVDETTGPALATMIQRIAPAAARAPRTKMASATVAIIELLDEILTTEFTLIADGDTYSPLAVIARWLQPSSYPEPVDSALRGVTRKLVSAIRLRARLGQKSEALLLRLRQALGSRDSAAEAMITIAESETGLLPEIDDWLRGRERDESPTAGAIASLLSTSGAAEVTQAIAALLLDCLEATDDSSQKDSRRSDDLRRICGRIQALAAELKLKIVGITGETVEFNPSAYQTADGTIPSNPIVRLRRPMVIRQRDDGSQDIITRGIVEG
jgi:hypothetical protein